MRLSERAAVVRSLIDEIDRYLSRISSEGIAGARRGIACARGREPEIVEAHEPACGWLDEALALARDERGCSLALAIAAARPYLNWITYDYGSPDIGPRFPKAHAFVSLIGPDAPVHAADFDLGLFLIAPNTLYRDHHHEAPELYVPLTGPHGWRFGTGGAWRDLPPHHAVWNEPWAVHATLVRDVPFLAIFAWMRDIASPAKVVKAEDWSKIEAGLGG